MHENKKHIYEIDQMMKFGWKLLLSMFMDVCW
jgi:NADH:ubiquinone oxidoreductase subunit H